MPDRYVQAIIKYLSRREYQPLRTSQLARAMGVADQEFNTFRDAVKQLHDSGRVVIGAKDALVLPDVSSRITGIYRSNPRGFGFITPQEANAAGDLYVSAEAAGGAISGDTVVAVVHKQGRRGGEAMYRGQIVEILKRGNNRFVGVLEQAEGATWFVMPEGKQLATPIRVRDISEASPKKGTKVVVEIVQYASAPGELPTGVIVESLGEKGKLEVETLAMIRAHGLSDVFDEAAMDDARAAIAAFDPSKPDGREDLTSQIIVTIDPPDARDFDDAISLELNDDGTTTLGVHIADVSHFVREGTELDTESRRRATSTYFPRKVVPMLPEILSNGVCSLQEGQRRYCKSAFIHYEANGRIINTRFSESVIQSSRRLTYEQAQQILDGKIGGYDPRVVELLNNLHTLARSIEARRRKAGMLHLDLPAVELVFDKHDHVVDAVPEDDAYTHTMIEMFMVEANDAVARKLDSLGRHFLRRIHPEPDLAGGKALSAFVKACGYKLPANLTRKDMQDLLAAVKGKPESYAVNLALLKTFEQAEYSPMPIGHFALASEHYCHFTSPIRRYPDLTVHRLFAQMCRGTLGSLPPDDLPELATLGSHCSAAERRSEAAERELREVLVLQFLETRIGESFDGVITGVTSFGIFVQAPRFLVEGLVRLEELGDDWWEVDAQRGQVSGGRTGKKYRIGDLLRVRIVGIDVARRQLNLSPDLRRQAKQPPVEKPKTSSKKQPKPLHTHTRGGTRKPQGRRSRRSGK